MFNGIVMNASVRFGIRPLKIMPLELTPLTNSDVAFIHETLERIKKVDTDFRVYAADHHHYKIGPPVPEYELIQYEEKIGIKLPTDWRSFLARVGPGAGPGAGLEYVTAKDQLEECDIHKPFPYTKAAQFERDRNGYYYPDGKFPGVVSLGYYGGPVFVYLVVNGPEYGTIWEQSEDEFIPSGMTFWQCYSRWLNYLNDVAIPTLQADAVVDQIFVGMTRSEAIEICGPIGGKMLETEREETQYTLEFGNLSSDIEMHISGSGEEDTVKRIVRYPIYNKSGDLGTSFTGLRP